MKNLALVLILAAAMSPVFASATTLQDIAAIPGCNISAETLHFCAGVVNPKDGNIKLSDIISVDYEGPEESTGCTWIYGFVWLKNDGGAQKLIDLKCGPGTL